MVLITHYQRLLDYIVPDRIHVLAGGRIVRSGGKDVLDLLAQARKVGREDRRSNAELAHQRLRRAGDRLGGERRVEREAERGDTESVEHF